MANTILTPTQVTREALRVLHQKLNFVGSITRDYDSSYAKTGARIGDTLKIRLPNEYQVRSGATLSAQDTVESSVSLQVNQQKGVDLNFTSVDLTLSLDDFSKRIIGPAMSRLAANIEADAMSMYKDVAQSTWNIGNAVTYNQILDARAGLNRALAPFDERTANLNSQDMVDLVKDTKTLFNDTKSIAMQYREGYMGTQSGFDFSENTMWANHTRGSTNQTGYTTDTTGFNSLVQANAVTSITVATGTNAVVKGDVFTIANVYAVHPETKANTGKLQQFVVTTGFTGAGSVAISPAIVGSGAYQNVTVTSGSSTAAITFAGTGLATGTGTSLLYNAGAFAFATADLQMPQGVDWSARESLDGLSIRMVRQYDITNDKFPCRLDVLYGYKTLRPNLAWRLHNN